MDTLPAPVTSADPRAYADRTSKMRESADIAKIAPALVRAQGAMENPPRNRSVQVRTQAGAYTFRYATLDKITEMTRRVLAENGLCVLQPIVSTDKGPALVTRLLHESGQWMECEILMPPLGNNPQSFGSAVTYLRRYSVSAMLNIAADEDDDANRATGNHVQDMPPRRDRVSGAGAERGRGRMRDGKGEAASGTGDGGAEDPARMGEAGALPDLVERARAAEGVEAGHALLEAWRRDAAALEALRGSRAWETLERELGAALQRTLGTDPAAAFVGALRAVSEPQVAALQRLWEGKWAETLSAMQREAPATYALLRRHVAAQIARVRGSDKSSGVPAPNEMPAFEARLRDRTGEVASDPFTDPVAFARAYADAWQTAFPPDRPALARHNVEALAQAAEHAAARAVLDALSPPVGDTPAGTRAEHPAAAGAIQADVDGGGAARPAPRPTRSGTPRAAA